VNIYRKSDIPTHLQEWFEPAEIGLEATPDEYVAKLVEVFREVRRVLRSDGTLWLVIGDSYNSAGRLDHGTHASGKQATNRASAIGADSCRSSASGLKPKDLVGIPWKIAFALQDDGWYLRSDVIEEVELYCPCGCGHVLEERVWRYGQDREIIWKKPNPMTESVSDRCTKSHEYIFMLTKSARYFYDAQAIAEPFTTDSKENYPARARITGRGEQGAAAARGNDQDRSGGFPPRSNGRNKRSVWTIASEPSCEKHYASFPTEIPRICIRAGTSERGCCSNCGAPMKRVFKKTDEVDGSAHGSRFDQGRSRKRRTQEGERTLKVFAGWKPSCRCNYPTVPCVVLDCFAGTGTTGEVAEAEGRDSILIELSGKYMGILRRRTGQVGLLQKAIAGQITKR
jgi:DNA modification methylase